MNRHVLIPDHPGDPDGQRRLRTGLRYSRQDHASRRPGIKINTGAMPDTAALHAPIWQRIVGRAKSLCDTALDACANLMQLIVDAVQSTMPVFVPGAGGGRPMVIHLSVSKSSGKRTVAVAPTRDELLASAAALRFYVVVLESKGGVGKSLTATVSYETLRVMTASDNILLLDADVVNRNLSRTGLTKAADALNAARIDFEGFLFEAAEQLISGEVDGVVIDSAAGGEENFRPHLAELARKLRLSNANVRLIIMRPLTTSPLVIDNISSFGTGCLTADMGVVLVRNLGQGRSNEDFAEFDASPEYADLLKSGMVQCVLESAGARYSDLVTGFNRSFADIARNEPHELGLRGRPLDIARKVFTRPVRTFLARWLYRQTERFREGMIKSVLRTLP